jgi:hypothetical protein
VGGEGHKSSFAKGKSLSITDREDFEDMLRNLTSDRRSIKKTMGFALDHADSENEVLDTSKTTCAATW